MRLHEGFSTYPLQERAVFTNLLQIDKGNHLVLLTSGEVVCTTW